MFYLLKLRRNNLILPSPKVRVILPAESTGAFTKATLSVTVLFP